MSFVLMEDLKRPLPKRRYAVFHAFHLMRPIYKLVRHTYRSSRFLIEKAIWVIRGNKALPADESTSVQEVARTPLR